ncbi:uncharacterized protein LOC128229965 isoform X2 [Mya arenaria]|uniref:uncharacterized protein LOC128229965 isoform X2 n=1 Tax=Mya arenaria TaxID=6604 RepID=UPI0022E3B109|nr:uncharacterized protein LOC128229965 isoform X2 [Mya arenaria]
MLFKASRQHLNVLYALYELVLETMYSYLIKSWMVICVFVWLSKDSSADVCSRAETLFQSTFPGTEEFSTDGISQDCYSSHLSCTESLLKRKYGSNMTWDKLDALPAEKFTLTARCENGNVIDVGWKLPQFNGVEAIKGFIVTVAMPYHHFRCVVILLKEKSTFWGFFGALSDHEEYRVSFRTLPSNGKLNQYQDIHTLNCDKPMCPPPEGVVSEYNHGNRTLFISFQPGEPGDIVYTMVFRSSIGQYFRLDLGTATNGTLNGVEPGNYTLWIRCGMLCPGCRYNITAPEASFVTTTTTFVGTDNRTKDSTTVSEVSLPNRAENNKGMSSLLVVICVSAVVALGVLIAVSYSCYRRKRATPTFGDADKNYLIIVEKAEPPSAKPLVDLLHAQFHPAISVVHSVGKDPLKQLIGGLTHRRRVCACFPIGYEQLFLHCKETNILICVLNDGRLLSFFDKVCTICQDAHSENSCLKFKTVAVHNGRFEGPRNIDSYQFGTDHSKLEETIAQYFDMDLNKTLNCETSFLQLPPEHSSVQNGKRKKYSVFSNTSSSGYSDANSALLMYRQTSQTTQLSLNSTPTSATPSNIFTLHPGVLYPQKGLPISRQRQLSDASAYYNNANPEAFDFIPPDDTISFESNFDEDDEDDEDNAEKKDNAENHMLKDYPANNASCVDPSNIEHIMNKMVALDARCSFI